jgi:hypothetical protein
MSICPAESESVRDHSYELRGNEFQIDCFRTRQGREFGQGLPGIWEEFSPWLPWVQAPQRARHIFDADCPVVYSMASQ